MWLVFYGFSFIIRVTDQISKTQARVMNIKEFMEKETGYDQSTLSGI